MSSKIRIELNREGVRQLLRSPEMEQICLDHANGALRRLGEGYSVSSMVGKNRVNAEISADTREARAENARNNTILKALKG